MKFTTQQLCQYLHRPRAQQCLLPNRNFALPFTPFLAWKLYGEYHGAPASDEALVVELLVERPALHPVFRLENPPVVSAGNSFISPNIYIDWFWKANSPTKS